MAIIQRFGHQKLQSLFKVHNYYWLECFTFSYPIWVGVHNELWSVHIFHLVQFSAKLNFFFFFDTAIRFWLNRLIASWNIYFFLIPNFSFFLFLFATNYKMIFFFLFNYHKIATCSVEKEKKMFCHSIFQVWLLDRLIASWKWCTSWPRTSRITGCWEFFRVLLQFLISCVRWRAEERGSSLCKR